MKTRILHTKIWTDCWFRQLSRTARDVFIYLLTNSRIGLIDTYEISDDVICFECQVNSKELKKAKDELQNKVLFVNGWVKVINLEKYQSFKGEKNEIAKKKERVLIPSDVKEKLYTLSIPYRYPSDTTSNKKSIIRNKKSETNNKKSVIRKRKVNRMIKKEILENKIIEIRNKYDFLKKI